MNDYILAVSLAISLLIIIGLIIYIRHLTILLDVSEEKVELYHRAIQEMTKWTEAVNAGRFREETIN